MIRIPAKHFSDIRFQHVNHRVPVTAIARSFPNLVLVAYSNHLAVIDEISKQVKCQLKIFDDQAIHGIVFDDNERLAVVWGGPWVAGVRVGPKADGTTIDLSILSRLRSIDWIFDIAISPGAPENKLLAAVTAHNALLTLSLNDLSRRGSSSPSMVKPLIPGTNCMLYSAHLLWLDEECCLIASGTADGNIIVWSCTLCLSGGTLFGKEQIHYTFLAHEGSVFDVQISDPVDLSNSAPSRRILASCSDDRTIRLWDITDFASRSLSRDQYYNAATGFGSSSDHESDAPLCLAKQMGHISRIWHVRFAIFEHALKILSFGEDAHSITWRLTKDSQLKPNTRMYHLQQVAMQHAHAGKNIWSLDTTPGQSVLTGGADGAIVLHGPQQFNGLSSIDLSQIFADAGGTGDSLKAYAFSQNGHLVCTTGGGSVVRLNVYSSCRLESIDLLDQCPKTLQGYSISAQHGSCVFIAGRDGSVYSVHDECTQVNLLARTNGKVVGLFGATLQDGRNVFRHLIVTNVGSSVGYLYDVDEDRVDIKWKVARTWSVELSQVVTSFVTFKFKSGTYAALGFRDGKAALYNLESSTEDIPLKPQTKLQLHAREAITCMYWIADHIYSSGRDGTYAVHRVVCDADGTVGLDAVHDSALPFGPNIEGICMTEEQHIWVWGFRSTRFMVFDVTLQCHVMSVDCGGANRNWVFQPSPGGGTFVWTKASQVFLQKQQAPPFESINGGGHGRDIKATAVLHGEYQLLATGAEDTNIKLHNFDVQKGFTCLATIRKHNTGIQHLQWYATKDDNGHDNGPLFLFSSAGFEEFFIWRITRNIPGIGIGHVCETPHPNSGKSDLRITHFEAAKNPEGDGFQITMIYSDSVLKQWVYDMKNWELYKEGDYLTFCLTRILTIHENVLVTAATDGHLAFWDIASPQDTSRMTWQIRWKVHQSAVLCAVTHRLADGTTLIVTGGDDNAAGFTRVQSISNDTEMLGLQQQTMVMRSPHAAAVTGLAVKEVSSSRFWLFSASLDQRIKVWDVEIDLKQGGLSGMTVVQRADVPTAVADVSGLSLCELNDGSQGVLVCGVGMDVWRMNEDLSP